jgi:hypothetical protein
MTIVKAAIFVSAILFAGSAAWAQSSGGMQGMDMQGMKMGKMMGTHMMAVTVTAVNSKTGLVDVTAGGMALKIHFPPASLANIEVGDSITLHLAFTKP